MREPSVQAGRPASKQWALTVIALVAFLDTFAMLPVLAPYARQLNASEAQAGLIVSVYSLTNLLASVGSGVLLDRFGRRLPMALSLLTAALLIALYGVVGSWDTLLLVRALHGASGAVFIPALFALVGEHGQANRVWAMGRTGAIIGLVALVAPPLAGIVAARYGEPILFFGIALLMGFAGLVALLSVSESHVHPPRETRLHPSEVLRQPMMRSVYLLTFGMTFAMGMLTYRLPTMLALAGYDAAYRGRLFGLFALLAIGMMASVRRRALFGGAFGRAMMGVGLIGAGSLLLEWVALPAGAWSAITLFGIGFGLCFPAVHLLSYEGAPTHLRGVALALLYAFYSLGYVLGPLSAGLSAESNPPGVLSALVALISLLIASRRCSIPHA
ncbi:Inner membrane transport protein YajR [bacterium HR15]|nr:Inner membrane transport protein YajR [bacterium HR15]